MNPTDEIANLILPKIFPELDDKPFFSLVIPTLYQSLENTPIFKIENIGDTNGNYASDKYRMRSYHLQVMVFIDLSSFDIEELKDRLDRGLEEYDYFQTYGDDRPHSENKNIYVLVRQYIHTRRK